MQSYQQVSNAWGLCPLSTQTWQGEHTKGIDLHLKDLRHFKRPLQLLLPFCNGRL